MCGSLICAETQAVRCRVSDRLFSTAVDLLTKALAISDARMAENHLSCWAGSSSVPHCRPPSLSGDSQDLLPAHPAQCSQRVPESLGKATSHLGDSCAWLALFTELPHPTSMPGESPLSAPLLLLSLSHRSHISATLVFKKSLLERWLSGGSAGCTG